MTDAEYIAMEKSTIVRSSRSSPLLPLVRAGNRALSALAPRLATQLAERLFLTPPRGRRPGAEIDLLATARARPMRVGARRIETWVWGRGPSVLLVHGWGGRGAQLGAFVGPLVARGFSVATFDAPGHGASDSGIVTIPEVTEAIRAVAVSRRRFAGLIAHSIGATAAVRALYDGLEAGAVVLVSPAADLRDPAVRFTERLGFSRAVRERMQSRIEEREGRSWSAFDVARLAPTLAMPLLVGHDDALHHRGEAHRADLPEIVDPDPEQLLGELRLLLGPDRLGLIDDLHDALDRCRRLDTLRALGLRPAPVERPQGQDRRVARVELRIAGEREPGGVLVPHLGHEVVVVPHLEVQRALPQLDDGLHADLLPVLGDELGDVGRGGEGRHHGELQDDALAVREQASAVRIALAEPELVEQLVGFVGSVLRVLLGVLVSREVGMPRGRHALSGLAEPEEDRLFDLITVDGLRERDAELPGGQELAAVRVGMLRLVQLDDAVGPAKGRPRDDTVLPRLLVLLEDGIVRHLDVALLHVEIAGDRRQVQGLDVGEEREPDLVEGR